MMLRKLFIIFVFCLFVPSISYARHQTIVYNSGCSVTEAGTEVTCDDGLDNDCDGLTDSDDDDCGAEYTPTIYLELDEAGGATQVHDETDNEDYVASVNDGDSSGDDFSYACTNNGFITGHNEDYIGLTTAHLAQGDNDITTVSKGTVKITFKPSEDLTSVDAEGYIFRMNSSGDGIAFLFLYGKLRLSIMEGYASQVYTWQESAGTLFTFSSGVCYTFVLNWDVAVGDNPNLWIDGDLETEETDSFGQDTGTISLSTLYINNKDANDADRFKGHLDEFKWYNNVEYTWSDLD